MKVRPSQVEELDPRDVFGVTAPQRDNRSRPVRGNKPAFPTLIGQSHRIREVSALIEKLGKTRWPTLIEGERGTGKEVVARAIHDQDRMGLFVDIDCAAMAGAHMESEIFGHVAGAFAGASTSKIGLIESANGGTAFFDSIDALPSGLQEELVRVLHEKQFRPLGETANRPAEFRFIAATTCNLTKEVAAGRFSRGLFHRINVVNIRLAPLRERREDIPALVSHFLTRLRGRLNVTTRAMAALLLYDWPENVRELESCIQYGAAVSTGESIDVSDLPPKLQRIFSENQRAFRPIEEDQPLDATTQRMNGQIPRSLWVHALNTFGSATLATEWFSVECGALHNRSPIDLLRAEEGREEVERILGCIDYGMIA